MAEPVPPPSAPSPETPRGLVAELLGFAGSLGQHVQALLALAGFEGRDAAAHYVRLLVILIAGLILLLFGYLLALFFVAFLIAHLSGLSWIWISLGLAVLHFVGAAVCLLYVRSGIKTPVFSSTFTELNKDLEALKRLKP